MSPSPRTLTTFLVAIAIGLTTQTAFAAPNTPPVANNDSATTPVNTPVNIAVLANDTPSSGNPIDPKQVKVARAPSNGVATVLSNGQIRYTPKTGFTGPDTFTYTVKGKQGPASNAATVTVTVQPANVPPVANNDSASTSVNTLVNIPVLANDTDANGNATINPTTVVVSDPPNGTAVSQPNGTVNYTPDSGFFGTDTFTYTVKDTAGATSNTATVTVGVNAAPVADAGDDANAVTGQPVTLDGSGSSDPNGGTITFSWRFLSVPITSALTDADIVNPTTPAPSFTPDVDGAYELELTVTDPGGLSDTDTVIITATTANVAPNADAGSDQNAEVNTLVTVNGGASTDPDNGPNPLTFQWAFATVPGGSALTNADISTPTSPQASFTPDVTGVYTLTLTVSDGDLTDSDDVDINVTQTNVPPNADAGADVLVQLGQVATLNGTASSDPDNFPAPLTFQWSFVSVAAGSTLTNANIVNATTPSPSFTPDQPGMYTLQLLVSDGSASDTDEVMVKANAAPVAVDDTYTTDEDAELNEPAPGVLTNDTDANSDALTAVLDTGPSDAASFTLNPDGSFDYTPNPGFSGDDTFTYHASDDAANGGNGADSNVATVTITVNEVNDAPVAVDDGGPAYTTNEDPAVPFAGPSVLTNDTDEENDPLTAVLNTGPSNASVFTLNPDGTFSYTPNADFFGTDTFTYHATDGNTPNPDSNVATVTITVNAVNDAPSFAATNPPPVLEDAGPQTVVGWASFNPGPANESGQTVLGYTVSNVSNPALFSALPAVAPNGTLTYRPADNAFGSSTFDVVVQDSGGIANGGVDTSGPQTFTITVTPVNDPPVATAKSHQTHSGIRLTIGASHTGKLKEGATDVDDPPGDLSVSATFSASTPAGATITLTDAATGTFTFNPPAGVSGLVTFQYQVCDDGIPTPPAMCSAPATVSFNVTGPDLWFVQQGASGTGRLTDPFGSLASLPAGRGSGDRIFVFTGTYPTGLTLFTNEQLIGQGSSGSFDTVLAVTVPGNGTLDTRPALGGTRPQLNGTVTVGGSSTVRGLNIATTGVTGLFGGAVTGVTVNEASVSATNATAVDLGAAGVFTLTRVDSSNAVNGIVLNNNPTGSFVVTGTGGAAGTGGTILNSTDNGIKATNVAGLSLSGLNITGSGDSTVDHADEGIDLNNLSGTASITNTSVTGSSHHNLFLDNSSGTLTSLTITGSTFNSAVGGDGILFRAIGTAAVTAVSVTGSTFSDNQVTGMHVIAQDTATISGFTVSGNTFTDANAGDGLNQEIGMDFNTAGTGNLTFNVLNNLTITGHNSHAMNIATGAEVGSGGTLNGRITGNNIGNAAVASSGSAIGNCIRVSINGGADTNLLFDGNTLRQCPNGRGMEIVGRNGTGGLDVTVTNNNVNPQAPANPLAAILVQSNCVTVCNTVRSDVRGNTVPNPSTSTDLLNTYIALVETSTSTLQLVDTGTASPNCSQQLTSTNTGSASANAGCALIAGPINTPP